jgi:hypothetical protein
MRKFTIDTIAVAFMGIGSGLRPSAIFAVAQATAGTEALQSSS